MCASVCVCVSQGGICVCVFFDLDNPQVLNGLDAFRNSLIGAIRIGN